MSSRIRIAFFAENLIEDLDGASRTIFNIINRIPKDKFEVVFYTGLPPKKSFEFKYVLVPTLSIPFNKDYSVALPQLVYFQLSHELKKFNPDIIHISTPSLLGNFALGFANSQKIPVSTIYHTHFISYIDYYFEKIPTLIRPIKNWVIKNQKNFYERCNAVYVPSRGMINELKTYGFNSQNFKIWPRGINADKFSVKKRNESKLHSITGNGYKNILFASRLVWEKNLKTLIKVYQDAISKSLKVNFIIAGDGVAKESLQKQMPKAFFLGHLDHNELSTIYASCDVFLFTSISETYGNVVAEAMASGLPCVIANGGGLAYFIEHGVNGFLCEPENSKAYLDNIIAILENDVLSNSFRLRGLEFTSKLDWENLTKTYFDDLTLIAYQSSINKIPSELDFSF